MIYLFNNNEEMIRIIPNSAIKRMYQTQKLTDENYISDRLDVEIQALNDEELSELEYMAIDDIENPQRFHYYFIVKETTEHNITSLVGVQSGIEELRKTPVYDMRPTNLSPKLIADRLLEGTNWQAGYTTDDVGTISTNFYYTDVFSALKKMCMAFGIEMQFFVEITTNRIGARYIEFRKRTGKSVGKRVVYGHNALKIVKEVEKTNTVTALIGRGKGVQVSVSDEGNIGYGRKIGFENVEWKTSSGAPVDKPLGQEFVEVPELTLKYGIKNSNGTVRPKIGFVEFQDEESETRLIDRTYNALLELSRPQVLLETSSVYLPDTGIGDTINVVRHDRDLRYQTRVFEITWDRLANQAVDMKLGDRLGESENKRISRISNQVSGSISTELGPSIDELVDRLTTADGKNTNWYTDYDPMENPETMGLVRVNDNWWQPDPEYEGEFILKQWNGEMWVEILRTSGNPEVVRRVEEAMAEAEQAKEDAQNAYVDSIAEAERLVSASETVWQKMEGYDEQVALIDASATSAQTKADQALEKAAGTNADLLTIHQNTLNTINTVTLPDIASSVGTALANAKDAMDETKKADGKIAEYVTRNGLVSGTTVDSKIDEATGNNQKITTLETNKLDSTTYTNFYENDYKQTAQGVTDAWTAVNKIVDEDGNTTDTFAKAVYDKNAQRQTASFNEVTKDLVTTATYSEGVKGINNSISSLRGNIKELTAARNLLKKSFHNSIESPSIVNTNYAIASWELEKKLEVGKTYTFRLFGHTNREQFLLFTPNGSKLLAGEMTNTSNKIIRRETTYNGFKNRNVWEVSFTLNKDQLDNMTSDRVLLYNYPETSKTMNGEVYWASLVEGSVGIDWSQSLTDNLGKAEFQIFKNDYENNDKLVKQRLTAIDSGKEGSIAYRLNETESTASGNTTTISNIKTKPGEQITGYQTIKDRSDLYERVIGSTNEATVKQNVSRIVMTDSVFQTEVIAKSDINTRIANATSISIDPNFSKGLGGVAVYNIAPNNTNVSLVHVKNLNSNATHSGAPNNDTMLEVYSRGQAQPDRGGFMVLTTANPWYEGGEYVLEMVGKLNTNASLEVNYNSLGVGGQIKWLTDNKGTGDYFKYQFYAKIGKNAHAMPLFFVSIKEPGDSIRYYQFTRVEAFDLNYTSSSKIVQLADSINLKVSNDDLLSQINIQADGVLIQSGTNKLNVTPTTTYIENGTIKSAMIDSVDVNKISGNIADFTTMVTKGLTANVVTSTHIKSDTALFDKLFSTNLATDRLAAQEAWITNANIKDLSASKITTGTLNAANVNIVNLNVNKLTGDAMSFISGAFVSNAGDLLLSGSGIRVNFTSGYSLRINGSGTNYYTSGGQVIGGLRTAVPSSGTSHTLSLLARKGYTVSMDYQGSLAYDQSNRALSVDGTSGNITIHRPIYESTSSVGLSFLRNQMGNVGWGLLLTSTRATGSGIFLADNGQVWIGVSGGYKQFT